MATSLPAAEQAASAASFTSSVGINTHIDFTWTGYGSLNRVESALNYLGIENVRDSPGTSADLNWWQQVAQATGVKFDAFIGETSPANYTVQLGLMKQLAGEGLLNAVEGGNEPDQPYAQSLGTSTTFAAQFQQQVWALGQSLGLPVIQTSFGQVADYGTTGDLSAWANYGNAHTYYGTGNNPGLPAWWNGVSYPNGTMQWLNAEAQLTTPGKPVITTESGYYTTGSTTDPTSVSETVQAKYTLDIMMDGFRNGDVRTYLYELLDQKTGDGYSEDNFGLFHSDGTPKLAATGVHNLMTLLADNGSNSFTPGKLSYDLSGLQSTDHSFLLEKSDGSYWLAVWNDTRLSGPRSPTDLTVPPHAVTLNLGSAAADIQVFDPLTGTKALSSASNTGSLTFNLPDHPILLEISGSGASTTDPTPTPAPAPSPTPTPSPTGPDITIPGPETFAAGSTDPVSGVSVTDSFAASHPGSLALNLSATSGTLTVTDANGVALAGSGTHALALTGTLDQINADLAHLSYTAGTTAGSDSITVDVWDQAGIEATRSIAVNVTTATAAPAPSPTPSPTGPVLNLPATDTVTAGSTAPVSGVSITDAFAAANPGSMIATLKAGSGTLTVTDGTGSVLAGSGTHTVSVTGTLSQINTDLAHLSYTAATTAGSDSISLDVWDQAGLESTGSVAVTVAAPAKTGPSITLPAGESVGTGSVTTLGGISISDTYAATHPGTMALNLTAGSGTLRMTDANGNVIAGSGTHAISVAGTLQQLNADLSHLSYAAPAGAGSDTVSVDVWDQLGLENTQSLAVSVTANQTTAAIAPAGSTLATAPATDSATIAVNSTTIGAGTGTQAQLLHGSAAGGTRTGGTETAAPPGTLPTRPGLPDLRALLADIGSKLRSDLSSWLPGSQAHGHDWTAIAPTRLAGLMTTDAAAMHGASRSGVAALLQHAMVH